MTVLCHRVDVKKTFVTIVVDFLSRVYDPMSLKRNPISQTLELGRRAINFVHPVRAIVSSTAATSRTWARSLQ